MRRVIACLLGTMALFLAGVFLTGCGSSQHLANDSTQAPTLGAQVQTAFLNTMNSAIGNSGYPSGGWRAQIGSQCADQNTGVALSKIDGALLEGSSGMLFHCSVDLVSSSGLSGTLYYLTLHTNRTWSALEEYQPLYPNLDKIDSCSGPGCQVIDINVPANLSGDLFGGKSSDTGGGPGSPNSGTASTSGSASSASSTTSTSSGSSSSGSQGTVIGCGYITDSQGGRWRTYLLGASSCSAANSALSAVLNHTAQQHVGSDQAHSYFSAGDWRCPFGQMGSQSCDLPATTPYRAVAQARDCGDTPDGGCPAQIPASNLNFGFK